MTTERESMDQDTTGAGAAGSGTAGAGMPGSLALGTADFAPVPLVDLAAQQAEVHQEVLAGIEALLRSAAFIGGEPVAAFEREYAQFCGAEHCVGASNGTDALELALRALGVGPGDEVILPAGTFVATAEAVHRAGATPVLVDVDEEHLLMDPAAAGAAVTSRTRAVIPVHLYGQCAPVERIAEAVGPSVPILEDAAQAQGALRHGRSAGTLGTVAATSFYPGKNLGAAGDAGAVLTSDPGLARAVRRIAEHGSLTKYQHDVPGFNARLDAVQAVVLRAKLARLPGWNARRAAAARRYDALLRDVPGVKLPATAPGNEHVWHLYMVRVPHRDAVLARLHAEGIGAGVHYPVPVHLTGAFAHLGHRRGDFPVAEAAADQVLSLPLYPHLSPEQQERVVAALARALQELGVEADARIAEPDAAATAG